MTAEKNSVDNFVNARNKDGRTALMFACKYGHLELVKWLVETLHANVLAESNDGSSVFDWCVYGANVNLMEFIADRHPELVTRKNKFDCSSVHWAAAGGDVKVLRWLQAFDKQLMRGSGVVLTFFSCLFSELYDLD